MTVRKRESAPRRAARATLRGLTAPARGLKALSSIVFARQGGLVWRFLPRTSFDYQAEVGDGLGSSVLMAPVLWMCRTFPEAPIQVLDQDNAPVAGHGMVKLLRRPNPHYSGKVLWKATLISWELAGRAYWLKVANQARSSVRELWYVPHWMMKAVSAETALTARPPESKLGDDYVSHYEYTVDGVVYPLAVEAVVHFRNGLDPRDPREGLSPLGSLYREVFTDDEAANFSAALLKNLGIPGVIISPEGEHSPSAEDIKATKEYVDEEFGGDRRGKPMTMSGPTKVQQFGFSPEQLTLKTLRRIPEERATAIHGVPAIVCGLGAGLDRSTFANFAEAREAAYEQKVIPAQGDFAEELRHQLLPDFGEGWETQEVVFDLSKVRVLQEDRNQEMERLAAAVKAGIFTRKRALEKLGEETTEADDVYLLPVSIVPTRADAPAPEVPPADPAKRKARPLSKQADHAGAMVALYPPADVAETLAIDGGEPATDVHLTLAFLGEAAEIEDPERLGAVVEGFAATAPALRGTVSGIGHFTAGPEPVTHALADVPGLNELRARLVEALSLAGFTPAAEHGFTPHMTLAYAEIDVEVENLELAFDQVALVLAGERTDYELTGIAPKRRRRVGRTPYGVGPPKARASAEAYELGLSVVEALDRDATALDAAFARELEPVLAGLGRAAADAYADRAEPGLAARSNGHTKATSDEDLAAGSAAAAADWADGRLRQRFESHWARTAQTTVQTINSVIDLEVMIPDLIGRELLRSGGTRRGLLDVSATTRRAILTAIAEGRAQGLGPPEIARRIRELVPAGRFAEAGPAYRAQLIARTETKVAQNLSSLAAYRDADTIRAVIAYDARGAGETDAECEGRDGEEMSFADAEAAAANEHPNGTLSFGPAVASSPAELIEA